MSSALISAIRNLTYARRPEHNQRGWRISCTATVGPNSIGCSSPALTGRELEVPAYLAAGKTNRDIETILGISSRTVAKYVEHILVRLGVETRTAAAAAGGETATSRF
jgi:DNA-binding NarL/FixJ family response regulator